MSWFRLGQEGSCSTGTLILQPRDRKISPLKTDFHYIRFSFRAGFTVRWKVNSAFLNKDTMNYL